MTILPQSDSKRVKLLPIDDLTKLAQLMNQSFQKEMIGLFGDCKASFDGRIKSFIPWGHRVILLKKDGSFLMHSPEGVKPVNWQLPGAGDFIFSTDEDEQLKIYTMRTKTKETMTVHFRTVHLALLYDAHDQASLEIYGSEADMVNYLVSFPELIDEDLQVTHTEYETPVGFIDIRGVDHEGLPMIIEVKKRSANPEDVHQLKRYVDYLEQEEGRKIKGYLVAASFPSKVKSFLIKNDLKAVEIAWDQIFPSLTKPSVTIDDFLE